MTENNNTPVELTDEQKQEQLERLQGSSIALEWQFQHPDYFPTQENGEMIGHWILTYRRGIFSSANLESAFEALRDKLTPSPTPEITVTPFAPPVEKSPYPWPILRTAQDVTNISREDYRRWMKDPLFVEQVGQICGSTRSRQAQKAEQRNAQTVSAMQKAIEGEK